MDSLAFDLIETTPLWSITIFSLIPLLTKALSKNKEIRPFHVCVYAMSGFLFSIACLLFIVNSKGVFLFSELLYLDKISWGISLIIIITSISTLSLFLAKKDHSVSRLFFSEYIFLFMNSVVGLLLVTWSNNLITTFIAVEHISLCFYLMIPLSRDRKLSIESALKYFILGSVGACFFLLGLSFVYISCGSLDFSFLSTQSSYLVQNSLLFLVGMIFIIIALLFKVSIFPFQFWLPDVYQGSATPLMAFMSVTVKAAVFIPLIKMMFFASLEQKEVLLSLLEWLAVGTLLVGHVSALFQENLKRMLIYSSIAHAGYMIMALLHVDALFSVFSLFYYILFYSVVNFGALAFLMFLEKDRTSGVLVSELKGLYKTHPFYSLIFSWFLVNLAGLPPSAGFFAKLFIFETLIQGDFWWMLLWAILSSAIGLFYYLRPIVSMYSLSSKPPQFENNKWVKDSLILQFVFSLIIILAISFITNQFYSLA